MTLEELIASQPDPRELKRALVSFRITVALFVALSLVLVFNPRLCWKIQYGWKFEDAKPSKAYLLMTRISGVISTIIWICIFFSAPPI